MLKRIVAILILATVIQFPSVVARADIPATERAALIALFESTNGFAWTNKWGWIIDAEGTFAPPGTEHMWNGVKTDRDNTTVLHVSLVKNQLSGSIPAELADLGKLKSLALNLNQLTGGIPSRARQSFRPGGSSAVQESAEWNHSTPAWQSLRFKDAFA
jgi:hypothetical protein